MVAQSLSFLGTGEKVGDTLVRLLCRAIVDLADLRPEETLRFLARVGEREAARGHDL